MEFNGPGMGDYGSTWQAGGYSGCGNVAPLIGTLAGRPAAVCGNAAGVFDEVQVCRDRFGLDLVILGVNDVGMYLDRMDHWVSLHGDKLDPWKTVRWAHGKGGDDVQIHSCAAYPSVQWEWNLLTPIFALSGYFALQIAWVMGCTPIILCGCPGSAARRFFEAAPRRDFSYGGGANGSDKGTRQQLVAEMARLPELKAAVRSMSGWTREFFGSLDGGLETWQPSQH